MSRTSSLRLFVFLAASWWCVLCQAQLQISAPTAGLVTIFPETADLQIGCEIGRKISIPTRAVISIENICDPAKWQTQQVQASACPNRSVSLLGVRFLGRQDLVLAESIALSAQDFHIRLFGVLEDVHGVRQLISSLERVEWCVSDGGAPQAPEMPAGTCKEPRQFAVAFDYGTPLSNKILTNGFSFYLRVRGSPPSGFDQEQAAEDVLFSFGRALTIWMAALQDNTTLLTPATRAFISSRTSTIPGGFTLLTPPQVVRLRCPHTAVFVVELNFGGDSTFPQSMFLTLAKARVEGRTIALNLRDVRCFKSMPDMHEGQFTLRDARCVNLLPILAHELGHAFGVAHIDTATGIALMNPVLSEQATVPTRSDVMALVAALERSVTGARPGELEFREAAGLLAPLTWIPIRER